MRKRYIGRPVLRTPLIVAGNNEKYIKKAFASDCDCIVLCLEDGVPENFKEDARKSIKETLNSDLIDHRPIFVRVNSLETGKTKYDIDGVACENLDGFLYTKPYNDSDILIFDEMITNKEKELGLEHGHLKIIVIKNLLMCRHHVEGCLLVYMLLELFWEVGTLDLDLKKCGMVIIHHIRVLLV